jgi:hypothetical protein
MKTDALVVKVNGTADEVVRAKVILDVHGGPKTAQTLALIPCLNSPLRRDSR